MYNNSKEFAHHTNCYLIFYLFGNSVRLAGNFISNYLLSHSFSQELQDTLEKQEASVKGLNTLGTDMSPQCSKDDRDHIKHQLVSINSRWAKVSNQLTEIKRRLVRIHDLLMWAPGENVKEVWIFYHNSIWAPNRPFMSLSKGRQIYILYILCVLGRRGRRSFWPS